MAGPPPIRADFAPFLGASEAVSAQGTYQPVSYWQETVQLVPGEPLAADIQCDVAIVGGGFTGLSTAHELKRRAPQLDVVVLERGVIGHGASGRNGGFVMPLLGWDLLHTERILGHEVARSAYRLMYDAVAHTIRFIQENRIDCDLETTGYLLLATCRRRAEHLKREVDLARRMGFEHEFLAPNDLAEHVRSEAFLAGAFDPRPAIINPAKLVRGMKTVVEQQQVRVFEQSPLTELLDGDIVTVKTPRATVRARAVVLAVNGYSGSIGLMSDRIAPVHTFIILTEPLGHDQLTAVGWAAKRTSLETARNLIHYFRLTADNRIAFGGEDAQLYPKDQYRDRDESIFRRLESRFRQYFPSLAQTRFTHRWGGVLGVTLDLLPTFGCGGQAGHLFHAMGYSGHGVALGNYAGVLLAPAILERLGIAQRDRACEPVFFGRKPPWMGRGTLRYLGVQAYRAQLRLADYWWGA